MPSLNRKQRSRKMVVRLSKKKDTNMKFLMRKMRKTDMDSENARFYVPTLSSGILALNPAQCSKIIYAKQESSKR